MDNWNPSTSIVKTLKTWMAISMDKMLLDENTSFHPRWDEYDNRKIPTQLDS